MSRKENTSHTALRKTRSTWEHKSVFYERTAVMLPNYFCQVAEVKPEEELCSQEFYYSDENHT